MKTDLYNKVTDQIIAALEQGVRPWMKPWSAEHAAGRITRPLRANGIPYQGINVLVLWSDAVVKGYSAPIWMTFRQALELNAHVRKGERGSTVVDKANEWRGPTIGIALECRGSRRSQTATPRGLKREGLLVVDHRDFATPFVRAGL